MKPMYADFTTRTVIDLVPIDPLYNDPILYDTVGDDDWKRANGRFYITRVNTPESNRGKGAASNLLKQVLAEADAEGVHLYLDIVPSTGLTFDQLEAWYKRLGFIHEDIPNSGFDYKDENGNKAHRPPYKWWHRPPQDSHLSSTPLDTHTTPPTPHISSTIVSS